MSLITDCADLARVEQSLGIIKAQKAAMIARTVDDMDDLHRALHNHADTDAPTWLSFSDASAAIRQTIEDYAGDAIDGLERRRAGLIERIEDECERRGLDDWRARNGLANAAIHRAALRRMLHEAWTLTGWTRDDLINSNTSPLYGFRSAWNAYRDRMGEAFAAARVRVAA